MLKNNNFIAIVAIMLLGVQSISAQLISREALSTIGGNSFAFIDGSSSVGYNASGANYAGKGILFPSTDLTAALSGAPFDSASVGAESYNPNYYDGTVVYNSGTGNTTLGTVVAVTTGFYYYSNPARVSVTGGTWEPLGGGGGGAFTITNNTPVDTHVINVDEDQEKVVSLVGSADGTTTHIDLGTTNIAANVVKQFRRANIYDGTGKLVLTASGDYDVATNIFVTGNGFMNLVLPAATDYTVELYYTAN